jgi:hypothetical protein
MKVELIKLNYSGQNFSFKLIQRRADVLNQFHYTAMSPDASVGRSTRYFTSGFTTQTKERQK